MGLSSELVVQLQSADRMVLHQRPIFWWGVALVCFLVALNDVRTGQYFFGAVFLGGGLVALLTTPQVAVTLDKAAGTLTYKQSILGRGEAQSFPLDAVEGVEVESGMRVGGVTRQSGGTGYRVRLAMRGGEHLALTPELSAGEAPKLATAKAVAEFLSVPLREGAQPAEEAP